MLYKSTIIKKKNNVLAMLALGVISMPSICHLMALPIFSVHGDSYARRIDRFNALSQEAPTERNVDAMRIVLDFIRENALRDQEEHPEVVGYLRHVGFAPEGEDQLAQLYALVRQRGMIVRGTQGEGGAAAQHEDDRGGAAGNSIPESLNCAGSRFSHRLSGNFQGRLTHEDMLAVREVMKSRGPAAMPESDELFAPSRRCSLRPQSTEITPLMAAAAKTTPVLSDFQVKEGNCGICFLPEALIHLVCEHAYCGDCLRGMLDVALRDKSTADLRCPEPACRMCIEQEDIERIADDQERINRLGVVQFIEAAVRAGYKLCPAPDCNGLFENDNAVARVYTCQYENDNGQACGARYCSQCLVLHGMDRTCVQAAEDRRAGVARNRIEEIQLQIWRLQHARPCPRCNVFIEKNEGCDHMTCRTPNCGNHFCWQCLGPYVGQTPGGCQSFTCFRPAIARRLAAERAQQLAQEQRDLSEAEKAIREGRLPAPARQQQQNGQQGGAGWWAAIRRNLF